MGNDHWFSPTNVLAIASILINGILTYMIWKATRKSAEATDASAKASYEVSKISERIYDKQQEEEKVLAKVYLNKQIQRIQTIISLYEKVIDVNNRDYIKMSGCETDHDLSEHELMKYFTARQRELIDEIWKLHNTFIKNNYKSQKGNWLEHLTESMHDRIREEGSNVYSQIHRLIGELKHTESE